MAKKIRPGALAIRSQTMTDPHTLSVPVVRDSQGTFTISFAWESLPTAARTFLVECGRAHLHHGVPTLQLAQLEPFASERQISRLVVVRFMPDRFVERAKKNEAFREELERQIVKRGEPGHFSRLLDGARPAQIPAAMFDAEVEVVVYAGQRASMTFLVSSGTELTMVAQGRKLSLDFSAEIEATMPTQVLADLLLSWKSLAAQLEPQ